jgi:ankyrin repeat protein
MRLITVLLLLPLLLLSGCGEPDRPSIPLYLALQRGDIDQIERHIYWGSDIHALTPDGRRPLQMAASQGNVVVVELLLKHGVDVNARDSEGVTALQTAILVGRTQVADVLLSHGAELDADRLLLQAAAQGNPDRDVVSYLVKHGADTEARDDNGDTPLLLAVRGGHLRLARHLVDRGADVNVSDREGRTALALAQSLGHTELAALLKRYGALAEPRTQQDTEKTEMP